MTPPPIATTLPAKDTYKLEGDIFEVLHGSGVAHLNATDGSVLCINKGTPGVDDFDQLKVGQRWRCTVLNPFIRVTFAQQLSSTPIQPKELP